LYFVGVLGKDFVQLLKQHGWTIDHVRGSHYILSKAGQHLSVPVHAGKERRSEERRVGKECM
jgi:predicted RNA binding protein YcfA (HicA-like mRNA interferase family)